MRKVKNLEEWFKNEKKIFVSRKTNLIGKILLVKGKKGLESKLKSLVSNQLRLFS